jgi:hypothetical protein
MLVSGFLIFIIQEGEQNSNDFILILRKKNSRQWFLSMLNASHPWRMINSNDDDDNASDSSKDEAQVLKMKASMMTNQM